MNRVTPSTVLTADAHVSFIVRSSLSSDVITLYTPSDWKEAHTANFSKHSTTQTVTMRSQRHWDCVCYFLQTVCGFINIPRLQGLTVCGTKVQEKICRFIGIICCVHCYDDIKISLVTDSKCFVSLCFAQTFKIRASHGPLYLHFLHHTVIIIDFVWLIMVKREICSPSVKRLIQEADL